MQNKMPEGVFSHPPLIIPIHQGTAANPGINQRALQLLFSEVRSKAADWDYAISVSAAEIYNEALRYREGGKNFRVGRAELLGSWHQWASPHAALLPVLPALPWLRSLFPGPWALDLAVQGFIFNYFSVHTALAKHPPLSSITYTGSQPCHRSCFPGPDAAAGASPSHPCPCSPGCYI